MRGGVGGLVLVARARGLLCGLPVPHIVETMRPLPVEPLPGSPPFVRGLSLIRGAPVPIVDVGALLGSAAPPRTTRLVTLRLAERRVGLALEEVLGLRELPESLGALPPLLGDAPADAVSAVGSLDAELLVVLQTARLLPESVWRALEPGLGGGEAR
jgi:purine-binding chemotaxis protein CheW